MRIASAQSTIMVRWHMVAVMLGFASVCSAQFPLADSDAADEFSTGATSKR